jgi:hypothetical protein
MPVRPVGGYSYVVIPAGRMFRILKAGQVIRGAGTSLGAQVSYVSETAKPQEIVRDAESLVAAFGPEMQLAGETALRVEVHWAHDPPAAPKLTFALKEGQWSRTSELPAVALGEGVMAADAVFPYEALKLRAAAAAAAHWIELLDSGAIEASVGGMNEEFRGQIRAAPERWLSVLQQRAGLGAPEQRQELYRMQTPNRVRTASPGDTALLEYEFDGVNGSRVLERIVMVFEGADRGWRTAGYVFAPIAGS